MGKESLISARERARRRNQLHSLPKPKKNERACLKCTKQFMSAGPHNRICESCRGVNRNNTSGSLSPVSMVGTGRAGTGGGDN